MAHQPALSGNTPASSVRQARPETQAQRPEILRHEAPLSKNGNNAPGLTLAGADNCSGIASWQFSTIEHRFQDLVDLAGSWQSDLLLGPQQDARA